MVTKLIEGHTRFRKDYFDHERELFETLAKGAQRPLALMLACCDSRVVPNLLVNAHPGDLFVVRNIANIVPPFKQEQVNRSVGAALEYAVHVLKVPHIIICGHTQCGGLQALANGPEALVSEMPTLAGWLRDAVSVLERLVSRWPQASVEEIARQLVFENVVVQLENLLTYPVVRKALDENRIEIHGWVYDLATAQVRVYEPSSNEFRPVELPSQGR